MKDLAYSDIKEYVKARLDELSNNEDALLVASSGAVADLDKEIEAAVLPAVRKIHLEAPNLLLRSGVEFTIVADRPGTITFTSPVAIGTTGYYKTTFVLPENFLRLISLKMSGWMRPIQTLVGEDSVESHKQQNPYLMGTPRKPVGVLLHAGGGTVELYSLPSSSVSMESGQYVPEPVKAGTLAEPTVSIVDTLEHSCLNQIVAEVLRSLNRHQDANVFEALAVRLFTVVPEWERLRPRISEKVNGQ